MWTILISIVSLARAQTAFSPLAVPLGVKSPYMNAWIPDGQHLMVNWPSFWGFGHILGLQGYVRVDGIAYSFLGSVPSTTNVSTFTSMAITPTQTNYTLQAGPMKVDLSFLSPIEPDDWTKQSFPFFYIAVSVSTTDNQAHNVSLYSDISGEWLSSNIADAFQWNASQTSTSIYHSLWLKDPQPLTENHGMSEDGIAYFGTSLKPGVTWQSGQDIIVREQFMSKGVLTDTYNTSFRTIEQDWQVFGLAAELGSIASSSSPMVWCIGKTHDPAINYTGNSGAQLRSSYFRSKYDADIATAIDDFLMDYPSAQQRANALDRKIMSDAGNISTDYAHLVALAARQTLAATEITLGKDSKGQWNLSDVKMFMREMGSGTAVNQVDTVYASFPAFLYLNASMAGKLLEPLLEYQSTSAYTNPYAAANLGFAYPHANGNPAAHSQGVEQSGNMLIMALAHARATGDGSLLSTYYNLFKGWADYLSANSLFPIGQMTADDISLGNYTNLAIKGIIGIQAMSEISRVVQQNDAASSYSKTASSMAKQWATSAGSADHLESVYGDPNSSCLMYNLYADKLLGTKLVYDLQTSYYRTKAGSAPAFGLPIDLNDPGNRVMSHWLAFTAATTSQNDVRDTLLGMIIKRAGNNRVTNGTFPTTYTADEGGGIGGYASAAQGAMFAHLALTIPNMVISAPVVSGSSSNPNLKHTNTTAIAGGTIAAVIAVLLGALAAVLIWRRRRNANIGPSPPHNRNRQVHFLNLSQAESECASSSSGQEEARRLRTELDQLRREMEEIRNAHQPPEYTSQYGGSLRA